jgi:hypothetical protein
LDYPNQDEGDTQYGARRNVRRKARPDRLGPDSRDGRGARGLVTGAACQHGLDLPLLDLIARRLGQGTGEHGDEDISATYLTSAPDQAA